MLEIKEKQELNVTNVLIYSGKVRQAELEIVQKNMEKAICDRGAMPVGNPIIAIHGCDASTVDIEMVIPIDKIVKSEGAYIFKERFCLNDIVHGLYKGEVNELQSNFDSFKQYINEHYVQQLGTVYYCIKYNMELTGYIEMDMYAKLE